MLNLAVTAGELTDGDADHGSQNFFEWLFMTDGFHSPSIKDFNPPGLLWDGTIFEFNRITFVRIVAAVLLIGIFYLATRKPSVVPSRSQSAVEFVLDFIRVEVAEAVLGEERAKKYTAMLTTIFLAILAFNLTGVLPFLNIAATSMIGLPIIMALWVYVMYLSAGIKEHGLGGFLKTNLFPPGVPWPIYILLTPVEILQVFILRPATLALRLGANMIAGHLMLVLTFAATHFFFLEASGWMAGLGAGTLIAAAAVTVFEVFVALLQAYIFVMLSAVYISMSVEHEH